MIMPTLNGKTALVTGGSRGIGRASALALAAAGAQVLVHYGRGAKEADAVVAEIRKGGGRADTVAADLAAADGASSLRGRPAASSAIAWTSLSPMRGSRKPQRSRKRPLRISINSSPSMSARRSFWCSSCFPYRHGSSVVLYLIARGARRRRHDLGLRGHERRHRHAGEAFRLALGPRGIRVNAVAPGVIETDMSNFPKPTRAIHVLGMQAFKRIGQPDDVGGVVAFLASEDARWITGDTIRVDGGSKL